MAVDGLKNGKTGKIDLIKVIGFIVPIATLALIGWLFMNGMMETPAQKKARIENMIQERLIEHAVIAGHPVMVERVSGLHTSLAEIKLRVEENAEVLNRLEVNQVGQERTMRRLEEKLDNLD